MSYDLNTYVRKDRVPSMTALSQELLRAGGRVEIVDVENLMTVSGYLPVTLDGAPTGFELYCDEITERRRAAYRRQLERDGATTDKRFEILMACDLDFWFACKASDEREMTAARIVAVALAEVARGWLSDPQTGETTPYGEA